jgi:aminoglycoside phosphotransferase family enzyme/predicted kinase
MTTPDFVAALLDPAAYGHPCGEIRLIETHISWVFLTGDFAYKVKKPVQFNFVDFSTVELRRHYCEEEVRCNRAFAAELYLGVVTINRDSRGHFQVDGSGESVESAVKMREFPGSQQLDNLLVAGGLDLEVMHRFGSDLADQHAKQPRLAGNEIDADELDANEVEVRVLKPVLDNFRTLQPLQATRAHHALLSRLETDSRRAYAELEDGLVQRLNDGFTRECHGDLHLSNLVLLDGRIRAFDCLEFNANLRWIDTASDVAFLLMDCSVRGRQDLGYAFLDGYLSRSADYQGAALSVFFQVYRSMVRAKVSALQLEETGASDDQVLIQRLASHLDWADQRLHREPGTLLLMCGFSGSGKSFLAERLASELPAVRVRSDVLRKVRAGLAADARSHSPVDGGLYTSNETELVYADMLRASEQLLLVGENVVVDATFLDRHLRGQFQQAAKRLGGACLVVHCRASQGTLEARVADRESEGVDASEAGLEVLHKQGSRFEAITDDELAIDVDTESPMNPADLVSRIRTMVG